MRSDEYFSEQFNSDLGGIEGLGFLAAGNIATVSRDSKSSGYTGLTDFPQ